MAGRKSNEAKLKELEKALERAIDKGMDELGDQLHRAYGECIDRFYKDYEPKQYGRTYSLYAGSDGSDRWGWRDNGPWPNKQKLGNGRYQVAITIGGSKILQNKGGNPYEDDVDYVFNRSYEEGIHGTCPGGVKPKKSKKNTQTTWDKHISWHKKPMSPPPIHFMEKAYNKYIATDSNCDEVFGRVISKELNRIKK